MNVHVRASAGLSFENPIAVTKILYKSNIKELKSQREKYNDKSSEQSNEL